MTQPEAPELPEAPSSGKRVAGAEWRRLHPLSPLLRGGIVLLVVGGIVISNLRERILELFIPEEYLDGQGPNESDLIDFIFERGLIIVALLAVLGAILLVVFFSWLSWRFHTFRISEEAVEERSGVIFRQHRRAPLDRIQSVNLQRSLLARVFGMTQIDVVTAGQGGKVALRYLGYQHAKEVREQILRARAESRGAKADGAGADGAYAGVAKADGAVDAAAAPEAVQSADSGSNRDLITSLDRRARDFADLDIEDEAWRAGSLVQVSPGRLIGSIVLSWDFLLVLLVVVGSMVAGFAWHPAALGIAVPLVLVLIAISFGHFNRGWGFTLSRSADRVRVGAGLTSTNTETVPLRRIHAVEARQPLGWRPFGWWRVRITTAGHAVSSGGQNRLQNLVLPVGVESDVLRVFEALLPDDATVADPEALRDQLVGAGTGFIGAGRRAAWVLWFGRRRAGILVDSGAALRIRRGALTRSLRVMPLVRAQSVQLRRPFVHRLLGLASLEAHTVLGPVHMQMRGLDLQAAQRIFDGLARTVVRVQAAEPDRHRDADTARAEVQ